MKQRIKGITSISLALLNLVGLGLLNSVVLSFSFFSYIFHAWSKISCSILSIRLIFYLNILFKCTKTLNTTILKYLYG